jgi:hypothetical protein
VLAPGSPTMSSAISRSDGEWEQASTGLSGTPTVVKSGNDASMAQDPYRARGTRHTNWWRPRWTDLVALAPLGLGAYGVAADRSDLFLIVCVLVALVILLAPRLREFRLRFQGPAGKGVEIESTFRFREEEEEAPTGDSARAAEPHEEQPRRSDAP